MKTGLAFKENAYAVECFIALKGDIYPKWHICRLFYNQGDAILFKELCDIHKIDPERFASTYRKGTICTSFSFNNETPKLKIIQL